MDRLFQLEVRALHEVPPLLDVGVEEFYEVCLVVLEERDADFRQVRARLGLLEHGFDVARDTGSELGRNGDGSEESLPEPSSGREELLPKRQFERFDHP